MKTHNIILTIWQALWFSPYLVLEYRYAARHEKGDSHGYHGRISAGTGAGAGL